MEQYEPDRLSPAQVGRHAAQPAQRPGRPHPPLAAARLRGRRARGRRPGDAERLRDPGGRQDRGRHRPPRTARPGEDGQLLQLDRVHGRRRQRQAPPHAGAVPPSAPASRSSYTEDINDNNEFFGKIKPQLAAGQDTGRDIIVLTDWLAARLIRLGWVQKLDPSHLPHAFANLSPQFRNPDWDPGRAYSYPWQGISTVIAYNKKALDGIEVKIRLRPARQPRSSRAGSASSPRCATRIGMTLLDMGKDPANFTDDDYDAAIARLQKAVDKGQIRRFTGNDYTSDLAKRRLRGLSRLGR